MKFCIEASQKLSYIPSLQEQYLMFLRGLSLLPTLSEYFIKLDCFMIHQQASKLIRPDRRRLKALEKIAIKIPVALFISQYPISVMYDNKSLYWISISSAPLVVLEFDGNKGRSSQSRWRIQFVGIR